VNAFERFFHSEHGASRSYLFSKSVLLMLALDIWLLMIGHAGRYGIDGFNVAHFRWLDAVLPTPSAAFYIAVLLLTGLLALYSMFTGLRTLPALVLFLLYTFSWSMSMLDSYQHHYFVSLVLLCLVFFPRPSALQIHPPSAIEATHRRRVSAKGPGSELRGWLYVASVTAAVAVYAAVDSTEHAFVAFALFAGAIILATWFYAPVAPGRPALCSGWGYSLLGATVAVVYAYTALAKVDHNWMQGHTLLRISHAEELFAPLADLATRLGMPRERTWAWLATLVVPQELALGACYLAAIHQDRLNKRWLHGVCLFGFALSVVLHVGAEAMGLQIGWFSYYMLLLSCCYLLPLRVVDRLATVFTWPARYIDRATKSWSTAAEFPKPASLAFAFASAALLLIAGARLDLPGALPACAIAAGLLLLRTGWLLWTRRTATKPTGHDPRRDAIAAALAALTMWIGIAAAPVRWDFYRFLGGDLKRRGERAAALVAYERGELYAPPGRSRAKQIAELRRQLAAKP
jgi:hypothetical protein